MGESYLIFRLEGPLQSWGERAKWNYRDTADFPTKSGVIGLIACALGLERDDPGIGSLCREITFAVRADRPGIRMTDFHTVTSDELHTAARKEKAQTIVSYRDYLQDASFLAALAGPLPLLTRIRDALKAPRWPVYLGRKSCVPSVPVLGELSDSFDSLEAVMCGYPRAERHADPIVCEMESQDGSGLKRFDIRTPGSARGFCARRTHQFPVAFREGGSDVSE